MSVKKEMTFGSVGRNHCHPRFTKTALLLVFLGLQLSVTISTIYHSTYGLRSFGEASLFNYLCEDFKLQFLLSMEFYRNLFLRLISKNRIENKGEEEVKLNEPKIHWREQ